MSGVQIANSFMQSYDNTPKPNRDKIKGNSEKISHIQHPQQIEIFEVLRENQALIQQLQQLQQFQELKLAQERKDEKQNEFCSNLLFQSFFKSNQIPSRVILNATSALVQTNLERCVLEVLKSMLNEENCLKEANEALRYLPKDSEDHLLKVLIYYLLVINKQSSYINSLKQELDKSNQTLGSCKKFQLCWKVSKSTTDAWFLEICWENAAQLFLTIPQASDILLEFTFDFVAWNWKSFDQNIRAKKTEQAETNTNKIRACLQTVRKLLSLIYHGILNDILGRFELFRMRKFNLYNPSSFKKEVDRLNEIKKVNNNLAMEVALFRHIFLKEPLVDFDPNWTLLESMGAIEHLRCGLVYFAQGLPHEAHNSLRIGIESLAQHSKHAHSLISNFQIQLFDLEGSKGHFLQRFVSTGLSIADRTPSMHERSEILKNCAATLEYLYEALIDSDSTMPLSLVTPPSAIYNLFVMLFNNLSKKNPEVEEYQEKQLKFTQLADETDDLSKYYL